MNIKFYKHQVDTLKATEKHDRVAYYLDMGLGKTFVGAERLYRYWNKYNFVICQKSKIDDWVEHLRTYYPDYDVRRWRLDYEEIPDHRTIWVMSYDLTWRRPYMAKVPDITLLLDESSYIKNPNSKRSRFICRSLKPKNVILLSGTPCGGKYEELLSQCNLLGWNITKREFWHRYINFIEIDTGSFKIPKVIGYKNVDELKSKMREYGAVFMKTQDVMELPEQRDIIERVKKPNKYNEMFKNDYVTLTDGTELVGDTTLTKMLYLRQICSQYNPHKADKLEDILAGCNEPVVIFYNFNEELEIIKKITKKLKRHFSQINGTKKDLEAYNKFTDTIVACQYQAAAMGHNLQRSYRIIYFSLCCSSELFEQSKKRIHRIGQKNTCCYHYLITKNSIEERIFETLKQRKDYTDELFKEEGYPEHIWKGGK